MLLPTCVRHKGRKLSSLLALALVALLPACATLVEGTSDTVTISTTPPGAVCTMDRNGQRVGAVSSTPSSVRIDKSRFDLQVTCTKDGHQPATTSVAPTFTGATFGNIIAGGLIGVAVDAASGANSRYPADVRLFLTPLTGTNTAGAPAAPVVQASTTNPIPPASPQTQTATASSLCPSNLSARRNNGTVVNYLGAAPGSPDLCIQEVNGKRQNLYLGIVPDDVPAAAKARHALLKVFEGTTGTNERYDDLQTNAFARESFTAEGDEQLTISGYPITAARITRITEANIWQRKITYWIDRRTGILVKQTHQALRSNGGEVEAFHVTRFAPPET